ncbi:ABC-three component system protein [Undibacterium sp.]|jgi:hypothetical protein|uniref:ABC-three component system protein n=1 Tax=Undibacterium sp. TaxID=1914977 RepID=UPI002C670A7F|nr:ABC-three component system protein [Undibacterium sp.]HTD05555.1 ABC-three component system protein [Undibacterium sp.]
MNTQEKVIARLMLKNKVLEADGQQFEDLFVSIMGYARSDFQPIRPQGKIGDRKNDGCEPTVGRYYQVYAPQNASTKESASVKKLETDFAGLKAYWGSMHSIGIQEFFFVLNDRYKGAFPTTHKALSEIQEKHSLQKADVFLCKDLERVVFEELEDDHIQLVVGFIPDTSMIVKVDYQVLNEVVAHILANIPNKAVPGKLISPEFETKLTFNELSAAAPYLKAGSYQSNAVESFFERNVDFARQAVRQSLNDMYMEAGQKGFTADPAIGLTAQDQMYFDILSSATPSVGKGQLPATQRAVQVLLAYFFESCDIFEEPT